MAPSLPARGGPGASKSVNRNPSGFGGKTSVGRGVAGKTTINTAPRRHRKVLRENIKGITRPAIRRLARRGGVKRISAGIYEETRAVLKTRLEQILSLCVIYVEHRQAKTVLITDVLHSLRRLGKPIYGFDPETAKPGQF